MLQKYWYDGIWMPFRVCALETLSQNTQQFKNDKIIKWIRPICFSTPKVLGHQLACYCRSSSAPHRSETEWARPWRWSGGIYDLGSTQCAQSQSSKAIGAIRTGVRSNCPHCFTNELQKSIMKGLFPKAARSSWTGHRSCPIPSQRNAGSSLITVPVPYNLGGPLATTGFRELRYLRINPVITRIWPHAHSKK